eukprot:15326079-Ditylum_brightwellii.AAC.2
MYQDLENLVILPEGETPALKRGNSEGDNIAVDNVEINDTEGGMNPLYLIAKASTNDNPTYNEVMNKPDTDGFRDTMDSKKGTLADMDFWIIIKPDALMNILGLAWAFKIKKKSKWHYQKAQGLSLHLQRTTDSWVNVFDTYAPAAIFTTVQLLLVFLLDLNGQWCKLSMQQWKKTSMWTCQGAITRKDMFLI